MQFAGYFIDILKALVGPLWPSLVCASSGVRFNYPTDHLIVSSNRIDATWRYRWLFGMKLAVFHVDGQRYWPQGAPIPGPEKKTLKKDVYAGDQDGQYTITIAAVSDDVRLAIRHYEDVNNTLWNDLQIDLCIPFEIHPYQMPPGIIELQRVTVTVQSNG